MNIFKPQKPYRFRPPKYSPLLEPLFAAYSEIFMLRRKFNVQGVTEEGARQVSELVKAGHSVLVTPNHADHADPFVLNYIGHRWKLPFHYMAAREGFERSRMNALAMQRSGVFSVDREGADIAAIKTAIKLLQGCRYPLVIFPEGEIYHHHEQLALVNEGVATIRLRAVENLPNGKQAYLVPTAMRYFYDESVAKTFTRRLTTLETRITWKPRPELDVVDRIYRLGSGLIAIKEVEFLGHGQPGNLVERIKNLQTKLVEQIEVKHAIQARAASTPERVKFLRQKIRKKIFDGGEALPPKEITAIYDDLDTLFLAVQLYSYTGEYLREQPSMHRIAESILKLEEDVLGDSEYAVARRAHVRFGQPINIRNFLGEHSLTVKSATAPLTERLAVSIQSMLEAGTSDSNSNDKRTAIDGQG